MSEIATRTPDAIEPRREKTPPLRLLPREWQKPVAYFAAFHSDILKGVAGIVARLRFWIKDDGLTLDEANDIMRRLMAPEKCAGFQYAGQLLAEMAFLVADKVRARRERERTERLAKIAGEQTDPGVRLLLDSIGKPFRDDDTPKE